jgi:pimeloyl-ACP methyl ester carboxylesterase
MRADGLSLSPQRRGRGRSDGVYDEGLSVDRSKGYTCQKEQSLAGAQRALADIEAAIKALRQRADVTADKMLMAGLSRGGALALAYAGRHPDDVLGAINFVGGWMGEVCKTAKQINQSLMNQGAKFPRLSLWLYGRDDAFFTIQHSRENFDAFRNAGGKGEFHEMSVAGDNNGHWVLSVPTLWSSVVDNYLNGLRKD